MNERYKKHIVISGIGEHGQEKLRQAKVLLVGTGGLGSPIAFYLTAVGIGRLGLVDSDKVDLSNLQRQIVHFTKDLGVKKVDSAKEKLNALNPEVNIITYPVKLDITNIQQIVEQYDIVIDAVDNAKTRYLINDYCYMHNKVVIEGSVSKLEGIFTTIIPNQTPCYRCIFPDGDNIDAKPLDGEQGVLGSVAGTIGSLMALETTKYILGLGNLATAKLIIFDGINLKYRQILLCKNKDCVLCSNK